MFWIGKKKRLLVEFANKTAEELFSAVPPALVEKHMDGKSKQATKKFQSGVDNALIRFTQFKTTEKPGIYGKAKAHQIFTQRLKELGYPDNVADEINNYILIKTP